MLFSGYFHLVEVDRKQWLPMKKNSKFCEAENELTARLPNTDEYHLCASINQLYDTGIQANIVK